MARARGFKWDNVQKKQFVVDSNGVETTLLDETGSGGSETASIATSTTSPSNPVDGDLWFDTTDGTMYIYYDDGTSSQWVGISGATGATGADGGVASYTDITARNAATPSTGDLAYITSTGGLYIWDSSEWDRIWAGEDSVPTWTTELSNDIIVLNTDGTPTTLTVAATDAEGFDITYTYDTSPSNQAQATIVNNNDGTFTLTPSTTASDIGDFILRVKATDGLQVISTTATARLTFSDDITFDSSEIGITTNSTNYVDWAYSAATNNWGMGASSELTSGRKYLEIEILPDSTAGYYIGLARSDLTQMSIGYNDPTGVVSYNQGAVWTNGTYFYPSPSFFHVNDGDVFQIAYDNTTNEVWFNKNNTAGAWWPSDPSSGTGHLLSGTSGQPFRLVFGSGGGSTTRIVGDIKTGSKTLSYPLPTGFSTH
jgi:hypothetical protein